MSKQTAIMAMNIKKGPSPEQKAEIDRVRRLFDKDWMLDTKMMEIKRKPRSIIRAIRDFFWPVRHDVFALYWWLKCEFRGNSDTGASLIPFTFPINHDNMPIPGYPIKYEIVGDWTIPKSNLWYLKKDH